MRSAFPTGNWAELVERCKLAYSAFLDAVHFALEAALNMPKEKDMVKGREGGGGGGGGGDRPPVGDVFVIWLQSAACCCAEAMHLALGDVVCRCDASGLDPLRGRLL